jgi:hypothetical protein
MRRVIAAAAALAGLLCAPGAAGAAGTFGIGDGSGPGVALDAAGTAYIAWNGPEAVTTLQFCRLPRGASACAPRSMIPAPGTADGRAFVLAYTGGLIVVSSRFTSSGRATYAFVSSDSGKSFEPASAIGNVAFNEAVAGPGASVSGTSQISGMLFQNAGIGGFATQSAQLSTDHTYGGALGFLDATTPLVVFNDGVTGDQQFRRYSGSGSLNDVANWTPAVGIGTGYFPSIAYGKAGLFLLSGSGTGPIAVRKWTGAGFGAPVGLEHGNSSTTNLFEDPAGRLHVVYVTNNPRRLVHVTSDNGTSWKTATLTTDVGSSVRDTRVAAGADHAGIAVWAQGLSGGLSEIRVAGLGGGVRAAAPRRRLVAVEGTYTLRGVPSCLRAGAALHVTLKFERKLSGVKIRHVDFYYEGRRVKKATRKPYRATIKVRSANAGSIYDVNVRIYGSFRGHNHTRTIHATAAGC